MKTAGWRWVFVARRGDVGPPGADREGSGCSSLLLSQFVGPAQDAGPSFHHVQEAG